jgi:metal-responsive CopG/Arc/MetJ family transcriptional regulator
METEKITLSMSKEVLRRLDELSKRVGLRRNDLIRNAVVEYLDRLESYYRIKKELGRLMELVKSFEDEDLVDLYAQLTKEVRRRGLI